MSPNLSMKFTKNVKRLVPLWRLALPMVLLVALMLSTGTHWVRGQSDVSAVPQVIASSPAPREVVPAGTVVHIEFSQPMDRASVEAGFNVNPTVSGKIDWLSDTALNFTPASALKRGQSYSVFIAATAKSKTGLPLSDAFRLTFDVTPNLAVNQVIPAPNAQNVEARGAITVVFDRPVVPLINSADQSTLPNPLTITPAVEGKGEWVGTAIYTFRPAKSLAGGTKYTVTVNNDLKDVDGSPLDKAFNWTFTTMPPQILSFYPDPGTQQVLLDSEISVQFNQPMDQSSVREAFTVHNAASGANVAGSITFNEDGSQFSFKPASKYELGTNYQFSIKASARSASGQSTLTNPVAATFTTVPYPRVINTDPPNGGLTDPGRGVNIQFSTQMDSASFADKVHIDPKPQNLTLSPGGNYLYINFLAEPASKYTITLDAGLKDIYGNEIKTPYTFSFTTKDYPPSLVLVVRDVAAFTSAYRPDTTIAVTSTNVNNIDVRMGTVALPQLLALSAQNNGYLNFSQNHPTSFTRQWTQQTGAKPNEQAITELKLAGDQGGKLPPGLYYLEVNSPQVNLLLAPREPQRQLVIVATAAMTIKVGPDEALVWVTDLKSGQPVPNAKVDLYDAYGKPLASGNTDNNGVFRAQVSGTAPYWVSATGDGVYSFGSSLWTDNSVYSGRGGQPMIVDGIKPYQPQQPNVYYNPYPRQDVVYLYTDQPVYRPDHPVYFRGIVRNQNDVTFAVPAGQPVEVVITDPEGKEVYKQPTTLNAYAAFNGKYQPPADAKLGPYNLRVRYKDQDFNLSFQVAQFRPPEFLVNVKPQVNRAAAGDTIKVDVDSSFFFGGPVSGAKVMWVAVANQGYFQYLGDEPFDFYPRFGGYYVYNRQVANGEGKLDDQGKFHLEFSADLGNIPVTQNFTIEATVTDISNQAISGRANVTVHPATLFVGLQPTAYVGQANKPLDVKVTLVDWDNAPQAGKAVKMTATELRWEQDPKTLQWSQNRNPVTETQLTLDDKGRAIFTFTPPHAGIYEVEGTARDSRERIASTKTTLWVQGPDKVNWNQGDKSLTLVSDKKSYKPGDTASVLIASPFAEPVQALITVERAGILRTDIVTITGSYTYKLPLETIHSPNVYISVAIMHGGGDKDVPDLRFGVLNIDVFVTQQLKVKVTPSTDKAEPGKEVKFTVLTTDLNDKPVAAEVGLSLADLANLSVGSANSVGIFDFFWHSRGLAVTTASPMTRLIDDIKIEDIDKLAKDRRQEGQVVLSSAAPAAPGVGGGIRKSDGPAERDEAGAADSISAQNGAFADGKVQQAPTPRTNFVDTPLWVPDLVTNSDGLGTASVTLPDNLTTWRLDARAISQQTFVGDTTVDVVSTKPLLVRPATPRFFVVGDETELAVVVNNNTDQDLSVNVALDAKGVTLKADAKQTVNVPKAGRTRITWLATVGNVDNVDLSFSAISGQYSDASKPAVGLGDQRLLPVYRYLSPDYVSTAGVLTQPGTRTEAVVVPSATLAPSGALTIKLNPSLAATTLDGLDYLKNYPYQCVEQTVSKFLPNVITFRALQKLHLDKPELHTKLLDAVNYAVARLKREQHGDGGWGWFPLDESNPLTTSYALLGLAEARASDLPIDQDMIDRAVGFIMSKLQPINDNTPFYEMNRQAFMLYVLAKVNNPNVTQMDALFARREKMSIYARAFLAQTYNLIRGDTNKTNTLLSDLQTAAIVSATGTHWEEKSRDWWNWDSDTRTTAIVLQTLVMFTPQSQLIPNVVRWLMVARRGDAWETTQETAWAVMALTNWMDVSGELKADYAYTVKLNDKPLGDGKANADTLRDTKTLQVAVADMLRDQANKIVIDHGDGPGSLYYTATLHVNQPVDAIKPTNRGLGFSRTYYVKGKPVVSAQVGDTITVVVEITANSDMYYVNVDDPIPAGTEILDTSLNTTSQVGQPPELTINDIYGRGWGWWWFSNTEARTEKMVLSATYLPRGSYRFVYQIRATSPGTYRVIPTNGQEFYFPEVFGRGAGSLFTVTQ